MNAVDAGGGADAGLMFDTCAEVEEAFRDFAWRTSSTTSCTEDSDCVLLATDWTCECEQREHIWGKDGTAVNASSLDAAQTFDDAFKQLCIPANGTCDGCRPMGAQCDRGTCVIAAAQVCCREECPPDVHCPSHDY